MIVLRKLKEKDAVLMLEWMHDAEIQKCFKKNMMDSTIDDTITFIKKAYYPYGNSKVHGESVHYAIADKESDEYYGTVSLKDINKDNGTAEYAIVLRKKAQGKGNAYQATKLILHIAFFELELHRVFLNVFSNNYDAINLYEKCGFKYEGELREHFFINNEFVNWKWYGMLKDEFNPDKWENNP